MFNDADYIAAQGGNLRDSAIPRFYEREIKNNFKSAQEGKPVYDIKEYVEILTPGTKSNPDRPVRDDDKRRWTAQYNAFKNNQTLQVDGTPLTMWPPIDKAQIEHLKAWNVVTVEQLSQLSDTALMHLGIGARQLQTNAKLWLEQAKDGSAVSRLVAENERLKNHSATVEGQLKDLAEQVKAMQAAQNGQGLTEAASQPMVSQDQINAMVAAALEAQPKNKGGRPKKSVETAEEA